jgi:transcription initiation factor TFIID subunit 7
MQWARKRRFRKRISNRTIEMVEAEVERLLREDEKAVESSWALVDADEDGRGNLADQDEDAEFDLLGNAGYDDEQDAEGEVDHEYEYAPESGHVVEEVEMDEETLVGDLDAALFEAEAEAETSDEDEDEDVAAPEPELDDAAKEKLLQKEKLREEIQDLEDMIASKETEMEKIENNILRQRVAKTLSGFRDQREMKLAMLEQLGG